MVASRRMLVVALTTAVSACHATDPHLAAVRDARSWTETTSLAIRQYRARQLSAAYVRDVVSGASAGLHTDAATLESDSSRDGASVVVDSLSALVTAMSADVAGGGTSALPAMAATLEPHRARLNAITDSLEKVNEAQR